MSFEQPDELKRLREERDSLLYHQTLVDREDLTPAERAEAKDAVESEKARLEEVLNRIAELEEAEGAEVPEEEE